MMPKVRRRATSRAICSCDTEPEGDASSPLPSSFSEKSFVSTMICQEKTQQSSKFDYISLNVTIYRSMRALMTDMTGLARRSRDPRGHASLGQALGAVMQQPVARRRPAGCSGASLPAGCLCCRATSARPAVFAASDQRSPTRHGAHARAPQSR